MKDSRFIVEWGKCPTDKWGHLLPSKLHTCGYSSRDEALTAAEMLSSQKKWRNCSVNVLDRQGPTLANHYDEDEPLPEHETWVIASYENGKRVFRNLLYYGFI